MPWQFRKGVDRLVSSCSQGFETVARVPGAHLTDRREGLCARMSASALKELLEKGVRSVTCSP